MASRGPNEPALPDPLAYFLTWSTYGTWLPGDERGWVEYRNGWQAPDPVRKREAEAYMTEDACVLDREQRALVEKTIADHCRVRGWQLYAVNCRTNHLHVVVTARVHPKRAQVQFKAWCTRRLKELEGRRGNGNTVVRSEWWAERGSRRWVNDEDSLELAIFYVREGQDRPREPHKPEAQARDAPPVTADSHQPSLALRVSEEPASSAVRPEHH